jgi:hypothetical protein
MLCEIKVNHDAVLLGFLISLKVEVTNEFVNAL